MLSIGKKSLPFPFLLPLRCSSELSDKSTTTFKFIFYEVLLYLKRPVDFSSLPHFLYLYKVGAMQRKAQKDWDCGS